jgi:hypothetical protein
MNAASTTRLGLFHCTFTGALVLGAIFLLCWASAAIADAPASRAFIGIFTQGSLGLPPRALAQGLTWSLIAGGVIGALIAFWFNLYAIVSRR